MKILVLLGLPIALAAQGTPPTKAPEQRPTAPASPAPQAKDAADSAVLRSLRLPQATSERRRAGQSDSSVRESIRKMRDAGVSADDAAAAAEDDARAAREGRSSEDSFGSFVRAQVESGKRGKELADAIAAERQRRGMGRPATADRGGRPEGRGAARPGGRGGRPDSAARTRPDTTTRGKAPNPNPRRP